MAKRMLKGALTLALASGALGSQALAAGAPALDLSGSDPQVRLQDDLFMHVNGGWLAKTQIPADKRGYGTFIILRERAQDHVREIVEAAAKDAHAAGDAQRMGAYYGALLDTPRLDALGTKPLAALFAPVEAAKTHADLAVAFAKVQRIGGDAPLAAYVNADEHDPNLNAVYLVQTGLGMPDRDYYLQASNADTQEAYKRYLTQLAKLSGFADPQAAAARVYALEEAIAKLHWTRVESRDSEKTYNPVDRAAWVRAESGFDWDAYLKAYGVPDGVKLVASQKSYLEALDDLFAAQSVDTWKDYLKLRLLDSYASKLSKPFRDADFAFNGTALSGVTEQEPRWKQALGSASYVFGDAIGVAYVKKHFPPAAKARMTQLVGNLEKAYEERLASLEWMTPDTRAKALAKLHAFTKKIGFPEKPRPVPAFAVDPHDAVGNSMRANEAIHARDMAEAGQPVDKSRWHMTPQTVNAYYNPVANEIVFPAAILQPPFFDLDADDAVNYGGIGAVIGHEMSHGFDDQGRHYDADGTLRDWWKPADEAAFKARSARLVAQYSGYEPIPGAKVNGELTLGENIADLCGVTVAYRAYQLSLGDKPAPTLGGLTGSQRFFLSYARIWRGKTRPEALKMKLTTDPHSPEQYRVNGVVTNLAAFHEAFGLKPGDRLYKAPADRVSIW